MTKQDLDDLRGWAECHVRAGVVQARQVLALLTELEVLRGELGLALINIERLNNERKLIEVAVNELKAETVSLIQRLEGK